jgi:hypothetical protein
MKCIVLYCIVLLGGYQWYYHNALGQVVDGWIIPHWPATLFRDGRINKGNVLLGSTSDEGTTFVSLDNAFQLQSSKNPGGATWASVGAWVVCNHMYTCYKC